MNLLIFNRHYSIKHEFARVGAAGETPSQPLERRQVRHPPGRSGVGHGDSAGVGLESTGRADRRLGQFALRADDGVHDDGLLLALHSLQRAFG